ncbi:hypothetical protein VTK56DRAFT_4776 [Thermocarpiscus australiensis]
MNPRPCSSLRESGPMPPCSGRWCWVSKTLERRWHTDKLVDPRNPQPRFSLEESGVMHSDSGRWRWVSETLEISIACLCSVVTWEYTAQNELPREYDMSVEQHLTENRADGFIFRPSPGLMLLSCLIFGCCVSSFTQRRQSQDPLQCVVYIVLLGGAAIIGCAVGANVHLILLGYLPWATCAAMAMSISGHGLYRRLKLDAGRSQGDEEKVSLMD